jgi:tRNA(Ile)-lysidine synthase
MSESLRVSARTGGERMILPGRTHSHAVKIALQDSGVPPWQRKRLPLVFAADGELLAVGDVLLSARAQAVGWHFRFDEAPESR